MESKNEILEKLSYAHSRASSRNTSSHMFRDSPFVQRCLLLQWPVTKKDISEVIGLGFKSVQMYIKIKNLNSQRFYLKVCKI